MKKAILSLALAALASAAAAQTSEPAAKPFAVVEGIAISAAEYDAAMQNGARQKFYHRSVPEAEMEAFRREVATGLIDRVLLLKEARRRGVEPDAERLRKTLAEYDSRYAQSEHWKTNREALLPGLKQRLEESDLLERLQAAVRAPRVPTDAELVAYYDAHRDQFTQPERSRVSVILLKVDPSSTSAVWAAAQEEAKAIRARIAGGADFAALARLHSHDPSAANGGDMGYLHQGTMPEAIQAQLKGMKPGEVSEAIRVLEGVVLLRLEDRQAATLRTLDEVKERAVQLWQREQGERAWKSFLVELRAAASIRVDSERYPWLSGAFLPGDPPAGPR